MPHLVIHRSHNACLRGSAQELFADLVAALSQVQTFPIESLKCRLQGHEAFQVAHGQDESFVHAELALLAGRDISVRQQIGQAVADVLAARVAQGPCQVSVELREMDRSSYVKRALPAP